MDHPKIKIIVPPPHPPSFNVFRIKFFKLTEWKTNHLNKGICTFRYGLHSLRNNFSKDLTCTALNVVIL